MLALQKIGISLLTIFLFSVVSVAQNNNVTLVKIRVAGNIKTKEYVVLHHTTFTLGDTISRAELAQQIVTSKANLTNTSLFNQIEVTELPVNNQYSEILIALSERWYTWPSLIFNLGGDPNINTWLLNSDFSRLNYGLGVERKNFLGRNHEIGATLQFGYSKKIALKYSIPYTKKHPKIGCGAGYSYTQNHEVVFATKNNKRLFLNDNTGELRTVQKAIAGLYYTPNLNTQHSLLPSYNLVKMNDTIKTTNTNYLSNNATSENYFSIHYQFKLGNRDNISYSLTGYGLEINLHKEGLGITDENSVNLFYAITAFRYHQKFSDRWFAGTGIWWKQTLQGTTPYYFQEGLGYKYYVRGYEYYIMDGQNFALWKGNIKWALLPKKDFNLNFIPLSQFNKTHLAVYLNVFMDAGYVNDNLYVIDNFLSNSLLYSAGAGIDFVTYYDSVLRMEFTVNKEAEFGVFLHFVKPI